MTAFFLLSVALFGPITEGSKVILTESLSIRSPGQDPGQEYSLDPGFRFKVVSRDGDWVHIDAFPNLKFPVAKFSLPRLTRARTKGRKSISALNGQ
jgi:hypothetical protein